MLNYQITPQIAFMQLLLYEQPSAIAWVNGNAAHPQLSGFVKFYQTSYGGIIVAAEVFGLPNINQPGSSNFYAMHLHEFGDCSGDFSKSGMHYNPTNQEHPAHAGDLPPLLGNQGYAFSVFYDKRFTISEIIEKSVIIHAQPDDFTTQPSGNSGEKIGCGEIKRAV